VRRGATYSTVSLLVTLTSGTTLPATGVTNPLDAELGEVAETDPELRRRREEELRSQGSTSIEAIVADVEEVEGVVQAVGFENTSDATDSDGLPPHSFEAVVWDGIGADASDDLIAQAIFDAKPAGIAAASATLAETHTGTAVEPVSGDEFTITFSRAEGVELYFEYDLATNDDYPVDGDAQVKAAGAAFVNDRRRIGSDVIAAKLYVPVLAAWVESDGTEHEAIAGVEDVTEIRFGATVSPINTANVTIAARQIALADTSRISVSS
jgi:hypothetical protein